VRRSSVVVGGECKCRTRVRQVSSHAVEIVSARDPEVGALMEALTVDLATGEYLPEQTFGYSAEQLEAKGVRLVGVRVDGALAGIGGIELQGGGVAELKRFYVVPASRGAGIADAVIAALLDHATSQGVTTVRLETGDRQYAAIGFYRRHGFVEIPRFAPYEDSATSVCMQRDLDRRVRVRSSRAPRTPGDRGA